MRQDVPERNMVEEYDTATDQWLIRAPMPTPRSATAWGIFNGRIYVAGGEIRHRDCGMPIWPWKRSIRRATHGRD